MQLLAQEKIACDNKLAVLCIESNLPKRKKRSLRNKRSLQTYDNETEYTKSSISMSTENPTKVSSSEHHISHVGYESNTFSDAELARYPFPEEMDDQIPLWLNDAKKGDNDESNNDNNNGFRVLGEQALLRVSPPDNNEDFPDDPDAEEEHQNNFQEQAMARDNMVNRKIIEMMDLMEERD